MYNTQSQPTYQQQSYMVNRPIYQQPMPQPFMGLKGRPVASIEEARGSIIDFDGSIFYFPDLANKRIYTKQINMDGTALMLMYELKELPTEESSANAQYVTREEFETALASLRQAVVPPVPQSVPAETVETPTTTGFALNF